MGAVLRCNARFVEAYPAGFIYGKGQIACVRRDIEAASIRPITVPIVAAMGY